MHNESMNRSLMLLWVRYANRNHHTLNWLYSYQSTQSHHRLLALCLHFLFSSITIHTSSTSRPQSNVSLSIICNSRTSSHHVLQKNTSNIVNFEFRSLKLRRVHRDRVSSDAHTNNYARVSLPIHCCTFPV
jgi:hypothetical protein